MSTTPPCCPTCKRPWPAQPDDVPMVDRLRQGCERLGIVVGYDDSVSEAEAAALLHRQPNTLRNWRMESAPIPFSRSGARIRYALADLAAFAVDQAKNSSD